MFIDSRKAYLNSLCEDDVDVELPEECGCPEGMCGKLNYWLHGFRPATAAWEKHYSDKFEGVGSKRGLSCGVVSYRKERDMSMASRGDGFYIMRY